MKNRIVGFILAVVMLFLAVVPAYASNEETFISEVALVYENSVEEARKAIKDTDWKLFEKDLNPKSDPLFDNGVYLIYKTTTDAEEAITDLRVMDMYGGYNSTNYDEQLKRTYEEYEDFVNNVIACTKEFKALYDADDEMAILAHRQMNFYKDVKVDKDSNETDLLMGDFLLNVPSTDAFVQVLMEGNSLVVMNLIKLLAIGVSGSGDRSLSARLEKVYAEFGEEELSAYYNEATTLSVEFEKLRAYVLRYDTLKDSYDFDKEEFTEEEFLFVSEYMSLVLMLEEFKLKDGNLCDLIREGEWEIDDLLPIAAALSKGQHALISVGQIDTVLKYHSQSKPMNELVAAVDDIEKDLKDENGVFTPIDVYYGVDRTIFEGNFAMTTAAERQQALTGKTWNMQKTQAAAYDFYLASLLTIVSDFSVMALIESAGVIAGKLHRWAKASCEGINNAPPFIYKYVNFVATKIAPYLNKIWATAGGIVLVAIGASLVATFYYYYNPNYEDIPNVMIDVRETNIGDKYIKYDAAKVFGDEKKNADFNAYEGKEWNALYYTKDATAGNCLTPNFKYSSSDSTVARRHQGVCMFGETEAFDLNTHVYNSSAPAVYLSIRYSNTKKAAADTPEVIGSMFVGGGLYALTAIGGVGVGVGGTILTSFVARKVTINKKKKLNEENTLENNV